MDRLFTGKVALPAAIPFLITWGLISGSWIGVAAVSKAANGARIPDLCFSYSPAELAPMFAQLGAGGRSAYLMMNRLDFFYALSYGLLFFVNMGWIAVRLFPRIRWLRWAGMLGVVGAVADEIENGIFRMMASGMQDSSFSLSNIAAVATPIKFMCTYPCLILIALGIATIVIRKWFTGNRINVS